MKNIVFIILIVVFAACGNNNDKADAYGNFEADEVLISAETNGKIVDFRIDAGDMLNKGDTVAMIDTIILALQKKQLLAKRQAIESKISGIMAQIDVQKKQIDILQSEKKRVKNLVEDDAAPQKQLDDIENNIAVVKKQIKSIETQNAGVLSEIKALDAQIEMNNEQIKRSVIVNPLPGTVLEYYAEEGEMANAGKVLYKIANLDELNMRAYISERQLTEIKIGDKVNVMIDGAENDMIAYEGSVSWIAESAEFTPKIIQTREERVNLVYAIKVKVKNDGSLKIGMPGEVWF